MKTKTFLITALLVCSFSFLYAGSPKTIIIKSNSMTIEILLFDDISWLAPETPAEATFEDSEPQSASGIARLSPITPKEATFDETVPDPVMPETLLSLQNIEPVTPGEAEFEEISEGVSVEVPVFLSIEPYLVSVVK